jgi:ABC-type transporter Mla maintaining outer membrane lipid asymmetry ATPase subunit MlaF
VSSIVVTHQLRDAYRIATSEAVREGAGVRIVQADADKSEEAEFIMLKDGGIHFEGHTAELRAKAAEDPYLKAFLS